jgi:HAMP domain-containing protein
MKLSIKNKLIIFSASLILIPLLLSAVLIIEIVNSNIEGQSQLSIEKDARVADQIYQNRQLALTQIVQNSAQAISAQGLLELAQSPGKGASDTTLRIQGEGSRRLNDVIKASMQASNIDFIVVTDSNGNLVAPLGEGAKEGSLKDNPLLLAIQNGVAAKKTDAKASAVRETAETLKMLGDEKLSKQAEVKGEGKAITDGLVLEAAAPITGGGGRLIGVIFAGLLTNNADQDKSIANLIKNTLYPELRGDSGASIALGDTIVCANLPIQSGGGVGLRIQGSPSDLPKANVETIDKQLYKTAYAPIKDINSQVVGRVGVQIKQSWFNAVLNRVEIIILLIVVIFLLLAAAAAVFAAQRLTRPIIELTEASNNISLGQLDQAIQIKSDDEIGQLAEALERMRISLKQALDRLRARR